MRSTFNSPICSGLNISIRYIKYVALLTVTILIVCGHVMPAYAGPALFLKTLSTPRLQNMTTSACIEKAFRVLNRRITGASKKISADEEEGFAFGVNNDVTVAVTCNSIRDILMVTIVVTSHNNSIASNLLSRLEGDMIRR